MRASPDKMKVARENVIFLTSDVFPDGEGRFVSEQFELGFSKSRRGLSWKLNSESEPSFVLDQSEAEIYHNKPLSTANQSRTQMAKIEALLRSNQKLELEFIANAKLRQVEEKMPTGFWACLFPCLFYGFQKRNTAPTYVEERPAKTIKLSKETDPEFFDYLYSEGLSDAHAEAFAGSDALRLRWILNFFSVCVLLRLGECSQDTTHLIWGTNYPTAEEQKKLRPLNFSPKVEKIEESASDTQSDLAHSSSAEKLEPTVWEERKANEERKPNLENASIFLLILNALKFYLDLLVSHFSTQTPTPGFSKSA